MAGTSYIEEYCPAHFENAEEGHEGDSQGHFFGAIRGTVSAKLPPPKYEAEVLSSTPIKNGKKSDLSTSKIGFSKNGQKSDLSASKIGVSKKGKKSDLSTSKNEISNKAFLNKLQVKSNYPKMRGDDLIASHPHDIKDHSKITKKIMPINQGLNAMCSQLLEWAVVYGADHHGNFTREFRVRLLADSGANISLVSLELALQLGATPISIPKTLNLSTIHGQSQIVDAYRIYIEVMGQKRSIDLLALAGLNQFYPEFNFKNLPKSVMKKYGIPDQFYQKAGVCSIVLGANLSDLFPRIVYQGLGLLIGVSKFTGNYCIQGNQNVSRTSYGNMIVSLGNNDDTDNHFEGASNGNNTKLHQPNSCNSYHNINRIAYNNMIVSLCNEHDTGKNYDHMSNEMNATFNQIKSCIEDVRELLPKCRTRFDPSAITGTNCS